jgi:hypothetical protein
VNASENYVVLPGLLLPLAAVRLALDLENRGLHLQLDGDDGLLVGPRDRLTDEDRDGIRRWRTHLRALIAYAEQGSPQ